ncbi:MAG: GntR family transcriptional regulator [Desulfovibrionales bacterium]|nr:GntR family transcriptional regulator [Desulfovibrionales bacterium]
MIERSTYSEQTVVYIKNKILRGELKSGDRIKESDLAEELKISRAPIREALLTLTQEGLIESKTRISRVIVSLTSKQIMDSYIVGGVLEGFAVAQSIHKFSADDFEQLEKIVEKMRKYAEAPKKLAELSRLDHAFHDAMFVHVDNQLLVDFSLRSYRGAVQFLLCRKWRETFTPESIYERHAALLDILKEGDPVTVERAIRAHYNDTGDVMSQFGSDRLGTE